MQYLLTDEQVRLEALASLKHLHTVCWLPSTARPTRLPVGPWLRSLHTLVLPCNLLAEPDSLRTLSGAQQLRQLGVTNWAHVHGSSQTGEAADERVQRIAHWAAGHASLDRLVLEAEPPVPDAVLAAARQQPRLRLNFAEDVAWETCGYQCRGASRYGWLDDE